VALLSWRFSDSVCSLFSSSVPFVVVSFLSFCCSCVFSGCQRANILYDRHIALVPEFSGHDKLAGTKFYNMADPRDEKWVHGTTKETARDRKGTPFPLPQTKPTYDRPARILVDKIEVTLLVGGGG